MNNQQKIERLTVAQSMLERAIANLILPSANDEPIKDLIVLDEEAQVIIIVKPLDLLTPDIPTQREFLFSRNLPPNPLDVTPEKEALKIAELGLPPGATLDPVTGVVVHGW